MPQLCCFLQSNIHVFYIHSHLQTFCAEELSRSQGLSLDVTTLPAPRRQEKPECIPSLQIPGSAAPTQPAGPVISIFDNFDAILEEDARVIENKMAVQDSGERDNPLK